MVDDKDNIEINQGSFKFLKVIKMLDSNCNWKHKKVGVIKLLFFCAIVSSFVKVILFYFLVNIFLN